MVVSAAPPQIDKTVELLAVSVALKVQLTPTLLLDSLDSIDEAAHLHSLIFAWVCSFPVDILGRLAAAWNYNHAPERARSLPHLTRPAQTDWRVSDGETIMRNMAVGTILSVLLFKALAQKGQDRFS